MTPCKSERQQGSHGSHQGGFLNFCVDAVIDVVSLLKPPEEVVGLGIHSASPQPGGIINPGFPYSLATGPRPPPSPHSFPPAPTSLLFGGSMSFLLQTLTLGSLLSSGTTGNVLDR